MIYKYYLTPPSANLEFCFYVVSSELNQNELEKLEEIISRNGKYKIHKKSNYKNPKEIGPHINFKTAWCQNMLDIFRICGLSGISRIEFSTLYPQFQQAPEYDKMLLKHYFMDYFESSMSSLNGLENNGIEYVDIKKYNSEMGLNLSEADVLTYQNIFNQLGRQPTNVEIYDIAQSQSEHARHWYFKGHIDSEKQSLFDKIKSCYQPEKHKSSLISFYDNASVVAGGLHTHLGIDIHKKYVEKVKDIDFSYKAETHNFPTGISPFPGAATGVGGRIRDILCVGKGGQIIAGTAGYCVGDINFTPQREDFKEEYGWLPSYPRKILIEASNGASDYGNKIGEPLIQGFTRSFRQDFKVSPLTLDKLNPKQLEDLPSRRVEWLKPIMFSGGMGSILRHNLKKNEPEDNHLIVRVGGPAYRIGMGGGSASSRTQSQDNQQDDFQAVQRGDPLMANKLLKFLRSVLNRGINPIVSIHDQGSGGMANVTREICEEKGATVYLNRVLSGDETLTSLEKWVAEYQEQVTMLVGENDLKILKMIGRRENISVVAVGRVNNTKHLKVYADENNQDEIAVDLPMVLPEEKKKYKTQAENINFYTLKESVGETDLIHRLEKVFSLVDVGSKQFLTNKVDRSVGGLVVQQQCVGPFHLPLSNLAAVKSSFDRPGVLVSAIGERPYFGNQQPIEDMVSMTIGEMLTNIIWCYIGNLECINSVANWMWPSTDSSDGNLLLRAVNQLTQMSKLLGFSINGGKDSLSMTVSRENEKVKAPATLTVSGYASIVDTQSIKTPNLKFSGSLILLVRLDKFRGSMLGSAYSRFYETNSLPTKWTGIENFKILWKVIQDFIKKGMIISGHDISDGGLLTSLVEMSISSTFGLDLNIRSDFKMEEYLFSEELGLVLEVSQKNYKFIMEKFKEKNIEVETLGHSKEEADVFISYNGMIVLHESNDELRFKWQKTSYKLEKEQANPLCIDEEIQNCMYLDYLPIKYPESIHQQLKFNNLMHHKFSSTKPKIAIMRCEGSNGEMEMAYAFHQVGFECVDVNIQDLLADNFCLETYRGIVWVGGFTFSDVLGAAEGWYQILVQNQEVKKKLDIFYHREDTFSLGVCNGCQLMARLGWVPGITMENNTSGRFESRWSQVKIVDDNNLFFKGMKDLVLGIYTAHGEGKIVVDENNNNANSYPVKYVDSIHRVTEKYPMNPNGSVDGRAAIISPNGRHLAIMPHPERTILGWQVPHQYSNNYTPWFIMFKNMFTWCIGEEEYYSSDDNE